MTWTIGLYVLYRRLLQKLSLNFSQSVFVCVRAHLCVCLRVWHECACACMHLSEHPVPLPLWPQHSCINTHPSTHPLTSVCVCVCVRDAEKCSTCTFQLWTNAEMRRSPEKPEREETKRRGGEREQRDSYKDILRGQTSEKVERDIWKRESLGHGGNCSCPTMIHWGKFSSASPSCPRTTPSNPLTSPHSLLPTWNDWSQQFCTSHTPSKTIWKSCADWYFDTNACPVFLLQWPKHEQH